MDFKLSKYVFSQYIERERHLKGSVRKEKVSESISTRGRDQELVPEKNHDQLV